MNGDRHDHIALFFEPNDQSDNFVVCSLCGFVLCVDVGLRCLGIFQRVALDFLELSLA